MFSDYCNEPCISLLSLISFCSAAENVLEKQSLPIRKLYKPIVMKVKFWVNTFNLTHQDEDNDELVTYIGFSIGGNGPFSPAAKVVDDGWVLKVRILVIVKTWSSTIYTRHIMPSNSTSWSVWSLLKERRW